MKKTISKFIVLTLILVFTATVSLAYVEPTASQPTGNATGNNPYGPITTSSTAQNKPAGLGLAGGLVVKNSMEIDQQAIFTGPVAGALTGTSSLTFGDATHPVSVQVNQNLNTNSLQSDTLKGTGNRELCSTPTGTIKVCP